MKLNEMVTPPPPLPTHTHIHAHTHPEATGIKKKFDQKKVLKGNKEFIEKQQRIGIFQTQISLGILLSKFFLFKCYLFSLMPHIMANAMF